MPTCKGKKQRARKIYLALSPLGCVSQTRNPNVQVNQGWDKRRVFPRRHLELNGGAFAGSRNQNCPDIFTERRDEHQLIAWMWHQPHGCLRNTSCGLDVGSHVGMTDAASIVLHLLGLAIRLLWLNLRSGHLEPLNFELLNCARRARCGTSVAEWIQREACRRGRKNNS
jgi:hypothetical protein